MLSTADEVGELDQFVQIAGLGGDVSKVKIIDIGILNVTGLLAILPHMELGISAMLFS